MTTPPAGPRAAELVTVPLVTDGDVLERVAAIVDPAARRLRTLWLFFLEHGGTQANLVVPVDGIPSRPAPAVIGNVCYVAAEAIAHNRALASVIIALSRPGTLRRTEDDRRLLRALQSGTARHATPVRMFCLATPEGVRELGPVGPVGPVGRVGRAGPAR
jgi:hypothetical protein